MRRQTWSYWSLVVAYFSFSCSRSSAASSDELCESATSEAETPSAALLQRKKGLSGARLHEFEDMFGNDFSSAVRDFVPALQEAFSSASAAVPPRPLAKLLEGTSAVRTASEAEASAASKTSEVHQQRSRTCDPGPNENQILVPDDPNASASHSSFHEVVGRDGVLVITLQRDASRFQYSKANLLKADIHPSRFFATDASCTGAAALDEGCVAQTNNTKGLCESMSKTGYGCETKAEQAIADSHRRALGAAAARDHEWTAILEDDAIPLRPERWDVAFKRAWKLLPPETKIVRLSWCMPGKESDIIQPTYEDAGDFKLIKWTGYITNYRAGGCTAAYMVHRSIIPDMLSVFPCCCAVDCCIENDLYNRVLQDSHNETRGMTMMMSLDTWGSNEYIKERSHGGWGQHFGVMLQARDKLGSTRE